MKDKEKNRWEEEKYHVESSSVNDLNGSAATEMTGLIPAKIQNGAELEAYKNLYPFSADEFVE